MSSLQACEFPVRSGCSHGGSGAKDAGEVVDLLSDMVGDELLMGEQAAEGQASMVVAAGTKQELGEAGAASRASRESVAALSLHEANQELAEDQLFFDIFRGCASQAGVRPNPTAPSQLPAGILRRALCLSSADQPDLAESDCTKGKATPFSRYRYDGGALMVCDHCEMMLRYHTTEAELSTVGNALKAFAEAPARRKAYLRRLATYLGLKSTEVHCKVHKVTLQKMDNIVAASARILAELEARANTGVGNETQTTTGHEGKFAPMSLKSYIRCHGNPLLNGHRLLQGVVADGVEILVHSPMSVPLGRHGLLQAVRGSAGEHWQSPTLSSVASMTTDNLDSLRLVQHCVREWACHENLKKEVSTLTMGPAATSEGGGSVRSVSASGSTSYGHARDSVEQASSNGTAFVAAAPSSSRHSVGGGSGCSAIAKPEAGTPTKVGGALPAMEALVPEPADATMARFPASPTAPCATPSPASKGLLASVAKDVDRCGKRVFELCKIFTQPQWRRTLRGKEKALGNLLERLEGEKSNCQARRREDQLPVLERLSEVTLAATRLVQQGKLKLQEGMDELAIHSDIGLVRNYLEEWQAKHGDTEEIHMMDIELQRAEVVGEFLKGIEAGESDASIKKLSFASCLKLFSQVGISPSQCEASCAAFLFDLISRPLVEVLRGQDTSADAIAAGHAKVVALLRASEAAFGDIQAMANLIGVLRSTDIMMSAACAHEGKVTHAPAVLREASKQVSALPPKACALSLAYQHGGFALFLTKTVKGMLASTAKDEVATLKFGHAKSRLQEALDTSEFSAKDMADCVEAINMAINRWGFSQREAMTKEVLEVFDILARSIDVWNAEISDAIRTEFSQNFVEILSEIESSKAGAKTPMAVEGEEGALADDAGADADARSGGKRDGGLRVSSSLEELLEKLDADISPELLGCHNVVGSAASALRAAEAAYKDASLSLAVDAKLISYHEEFEQFIDCARFLKAFAQALQCLVSERASAPYNVLLSEWQAWNLLSCESRDEVGLPILQLLLVGAASVRDLSGWKDARPHTQELSAMDEVTNTILGSTVSSEFGALIKDKASDAMAAAQRATLTRLLALQEPTTIRRWADEGRLCACLSLLLSGADTDASTNVANLPAVKGAIAGVMQRMGGLIPEDCTLWPHAAASGLAKKLLEMLELQCVGNEECAAIM